MYSFCNYGGRRRQTGGTLIGFMAGLVFGLAIAVFVAIFVTRSPVPFVNRLAKSPDRIEPKTGVDAPDPNKPLQSSRTKPNSTANSADASAKPSVLGGILNNPDNKPAAPAPAAAPAAPIATAPAATPDPKPADAAKDEKVAYVLQAGAFKSQDDADNMKARLALVGYEARILTAEVNGQTLYRVRVGPYVGLDDMNKARGKLAEGGIEAAVIRQR
jgi:cell division protein FtsN